MSSGSFTVSSCHISHLFTVFYFKPLSVVFFSQICVNFTVVIVLLLSVKNFGA